MEPIQWFVVGAIVVGALDEIIHNSPYRSNNTLQLLMAALKAIFRVKD
jgi:hypothetical protein